MSVNAPVRAVFSTLNLMDPPSDLPPGAMSGVGADACMESAFAFSLRITPAVASENPITATKSCRFGGSILIGQ